MLVTVDGPPGGLDQIARPVDAFNGIPTPREFASISARSTAGIEKHCAGKDAPLAEPGGDRGALLTDRAVDQQVERPRVLAVKGATRLLGHGSRQNCITTLSPDYAARMSRFTTQRARTTPRPAHARRQTRSRPARRCSGRSPTSRARHRVRPTRPVRVRW